MGSLGVGGAGGAFGGGVDGGDIMNPVRISLFSRRRTVCLIWQIILIEMGMIDWIEMVLMMQRMTAMAIVMRTRRRRRRRKG